MAETGIIYNMGGTLSRYAWGRVIRIRFTSRKKKAAIEFDSTKTDALAIRINGYKYMSTLKDACTIEIYNLDYSEILRLISDEYYDVEVYAGYKTSGAQCIFRGGVLYISNNLNERRTNIATILCASNAVARFGQRRLNLTLNSGINMYSAIKFICDRAGMGNVELSKNLRTRWLSQLTNVNDTAAAWINKLTEQNDTYVSSTDESLGAYVTLYDANQSDRRIIDLREEWIDFTNGYPRQNSSGLTITLMPTTQIMCGDIIRLDPAIINIGVGTAEEAAKNYGIYLDKDGCYIVYQIHYALENRGSEFSLELLCKPRSLFSSITGTLSK